MRKKTTMATVFLVTFLILAVGLKPDNLARANWLFVDNYPPSISIIYPQANEVCPSSFQLTYNVTYDWIFDQVIGSDIRSCLAYDLDGKVYLPSAKIVSSSIVNIPNTKRNNESQWVMDIRGLESGMHTLSINMVLPSFWKYDFPVTGIRFASASVIFNVDASVPRISILSPANMTYPASEISLDFEASDTLSWATYSLDGNANISITENFVLTGLSEGNHSIVVYANNTIGNIGKSNVVFFTVDLPDPTPSLSPSPSPTIEPTLELDYWSLLTYGKDLEEIREVRTAMTLELSFTVNDDGNNTFLFHRYSEKGTNENITLYTNDRVTINPLSNYALNVTLYSSTKYGYKIEFSGRADFVKINGLVIFEVPHQNAQTPSPSPITTPSSTVEPTLEPTQTATPSNDDNQTLDLMPILALTGVVMAAITVGILVYFKRKKG